MMVLMSLPFFFLPIINLRRLLLTVERSQVELLAIHPNVAFELAREPVNRDTSELGSLVCNTRKGCRGGVVL